MNEQKKGYYEKEEVDRYVTELIKDYEENLASQKERIFSQVEDIEKLKGELYTYKKREKYINSAILSALAKADEIESGAKARHEAELQKLHAFYTKFVAYYDHIRAKYPPDPEFDQIEQFIGSMEGILEKPRAQQGANAPLSPEDERIMEAYGEERHRLLKNGWQIKPLEEQINNPDMQGKTEKLFNKNVSGAEEIAANLLVGLDIKTPIGKIKKHLDKQLPKEQPPAVIDLEELLKPAQSLEDLCAELGLFDPNTNSKKKK